MSYVEDRIREVTEHPPAVRRLSNVEKFKTRHGKTVFYYRNGKGRRTRLPDPDVVGLDEFQKAHAMAAAGGVALAPTARGRSPSVLMEVGKPGYVYFAKVGHRVKIGFTTSLKSRVKGIQTSCADPVEVLMVMPGTQGTEKFIHDRFSNNRVGGEWFNLVGALAEFVRYVPPKF